MRLLVCGDRNWNDFPTILACIASLQPDIVIEGECGKHNKTVYIGADIMARDAARQLGIPVAPFPAKWNEEGLAAGPIRNQKQLDEGKPTHCLAFHANIESSKGTKDMIKRCKKAGLPVRLVTSSGSYRDL